MSKRPFSDPEDAKKLPGGAADNRFYIDPEPPRGELTGKNNDTGDWMPATISGRIHGQLLYQPVTHPDDRYEETGVARPSDENVSFNREWIQENEL